VKSTPPTTFSSRPSNLGPASLEIVTFHPALAAEFAHLNRAWIEEFFTLEEADRRVFADPERVIVRPGGQVFFALLGGRVVGTCAALRHSDSQVELAKMAVDPGARGQGIGRRLGLAVIAFARVAGARVVTLLSSRRLPAALALYRKLGFVERPLPATTGYQRADVYMELRLDPPDLERAGAP
jgi:GNAT superfamily N-acetyltransferase